MTLHNWQAMGRHFNFNGHTIFYVDTHTQPHTHTHTQPQPQPLLLIHGFPTASWDWSRLWLKLSEHFRVVAPDMIGFGFSDKPHDYPYQISDQADLIEALLDHLGLDEVHVLAHDYGDTVAQELLARQQSKLLSFRCTSVGLLNGGLFPEAYRPRFIQRLLMSPLGPFIARFMGRSSLRRTFRRIFGPETPPAEAELDDFWALIEYHEGKRRIPQLIRYMKEREEHADRWTSALQKARVPLRLIDGAADPISGRHMAEYYHKHIPRPDIVLLEGIGHYPQWEAPEQVLKHYLAFAGTVPAPDP